MKLELFAPTERDSELGAQKIVHKDHPVEPDGSKSSCSARTVRTVRIHTSGSLQRHDMKHEAWHLMWRHHHIAHDINFHSYV